MEGIVDSHRTTPGMPSSRAVLVTGCSSGIGHATALVLAKAGFPVWASARDVTGLGELEAAGCRVLELDVTDEQSRIAAVRQVEAEHGAVGVLVNNAGHGGGGPVEEFPLDIVRETFETNVFAVVRLCQLALPSMRARRSGLIVNIGSVAGLITLPAEFPYATTKCAVESLSDSLRLDAAPFGISVTLIEPGPVRTRFMDNAELHRPTADENSPYAVYKANAAKLIAGAHRSDGPFGVLKAADVAAVILKAATAPRPKARYKVGGQARLGPAARRILSDRGWDALMRLMVPFPAPPAQGR